MCMHACTVCTHTIVHEHTHTHTHTHIHAHTQIYIVQTDTHTCARAHAHTHTHTHKQKLHTWMQLLGYRWATQTQRHSPVRWMHQSLHPHTQISTSLTLWRDASTGMFCVACSDMTGWWDGMHIMCVCVHTQWYNYYTISRITSGGRVVPYNSTTAVNRKQVELLSNLTQYISYCH